MVNLKLLNGYLAIRFVCGFSLKTSTTNISCGIIKSQNKILIVGPGVEEFPDDSDLPTELETLQFCANLYFGGNWSKRECAIKTAHAVSLIWNRRGVEPQQIYRAADKVQKIFQIFYEMWAKRNVNGVRAQQKRIAFVEKIANTVFEISKTVNVVHEPAQVDIRPLPNEPQIRANEQIAGPSHANVPVLYIEEQQEHQNHAEVANNIDNNNPNRNLRNRREVLREAVEVKPDKDVCIMFDHIGVSHRYASLAFITMAKFFGTEPENIVSSASTMYRCRQLHRERESINIKENFDSSEMLTLHWDAKTYTSRGSVKNKKLAVVVSNSKTAKLLEIQTVRDGSADAHTQAVLEVINDWNVEANIVSMCFDTEAVNTGRISGVCIQLENEFGRYLLHLACRLHVSEILLSAGFGATVEKAKDADGPKIPIFEQFSRQYFSPEFNRQNYKNCCDDEFFIKLIGVEEMEHIAAFCRTKLETVIQRNDYAELLKLTLIMVSPDCEFNVYAPGAYNRARFMCRVIYCIKIYLYRDQLPPKSKTMDNIRRFLLYFLKVHLRYWFNTRQAVKAPNQDLNMLKNLHDLKEILPITANAVISKLNNHLCYLSETLIALSFFDDDVPVAEKLLMVNNLRNKDPEEHENVNRCTIPDGACVRNLRLSDFVTKRTRRFFAISRIKMDFLSIHPSRWYASLDFINGQMKAKSFSVTNDAAERSIALYQTYKDNIKKPEQERHLLQVAEKRRRECKTLRKQDVINSLDFQ